VKTLIELQDDLSHKTKCAKDVIAKAEKENRQLTNAETADVETFLREADELKKQIERIENDNKLRAQVDAAISALGKTTPPKSSPDPITNEPHTVPAQPKGYRFGRLKAFKNEQDAWKSAVWMKAAIFGDRRAEREAMNLGLDIRNSMSEGVNTAGGAIVPDEMSQTIIDLREIYGVFRRNTKVVAMGREVMTMPRRTGGLTAYFTAENTAITASDKSFNQVNLVAKKLGVLTYLSTELDQDAVISIVDDLASEMAYSFALKEDQCGFTGDGTSTYGGVYGLTQRILDSANTASAVDCATAGHDTFAEVDATDLATLMGKLPVYAMQNAKFYCSGVAKSLVFDRLLATAGGNTVGTLQGSTGGSYLGYPIVVSQVLPTSTGNLNNLPMLFFGDLTLASTMGDRRGIAVRRDDSYKFAEDQITLKATERVDIVVHDLGDTSTAGPIVGLIGFTS